MTRSSGRVRFGGGKLIIPEERTGRATTAYRGEPASANCSAGIRFAALWCLLWFVTTVSMVLERYLNPAAGSKHILGGDKTLESRCAAARRELAQPSREAPAHYDGYLSYVEDACRGVDE